MTKSVQKIKFRANYEPSVPVNLATPPEEGRTKQADKDSCDINQILAKYAKTGLVPGNSKLPRYGDFSSAVSYQESLNLVMEAQELFSQMPAKARAFFENDPAKFLAFVEDPKNGPKLIELGLATAKPDLATTPPPAASNPPSDLKKEPPKSDAK